jgi:SpoVK/Ycf46/Vps4 family AAA+-type ATPase
MLGAIHGARAPESRYGVSVMALTPPSQAHPPWAARIRDTYARREAAAFVLHGNVNDIFPLAGQYVSSRRYVESMLAKGQYIVIGYDVSRGMRFEDAKEAEEFVRLANQHRNDGDKLVRSVYDFPRESLKALAFIEAFIVGLDSSKRPVALMLDYAEHVAPNGSPSSLTEVDRINSVTLQRFARLFYERLLDPGARDAALFMFSPNLHDLAPDLVQSEVVTAIEIPRPDAEARRQFLAHQQAKLVVDGQAELELDVSNEQFVAQTAGLTLTGIGQLFLKALHQPARRLSAEFILEKKRELIERDSRGMLEVLSPKHGMSAVGGNQSIKQFFTRTGEDLRGGLRDVPIGVICPGPNGVGKTFIAKAFARDSGLNCVALKNFRGMYVGQTESNLDTIFSILRAMTPNVVIMDEADKTLGNETASEGNKVDERVFGAFTAFMGDPDYRGKIFWLLLTARPFNLAPDTGRPGRVEEHVPILAPETFAEKQSILRAVARGAGVELVGDEGTAEPGEAELALLFEGLGFVTPAALELIVNRARRVARRARPSDGEPVRVRFGELSAEARNFVPESSNAKLRLQTLEAVLYTNHLEYLPESWRARLRDDAEGLAREREELRRLVGYT